MGFTVTQEKDKDFHERSYAQTADDKQVQGKGSAGGATRVTFWNFAPAIFLSQMEQVEASGSIPPSIKLHWQTDRQATLLR